MSKDFSGISGGSPWQKSRADLSPLGRPGPRAGQASTTHPNPCTASAPTLQQGAITGHGLHTRNARGACLC